MRKRNTAWLTYQNSLNLPTKHYITYFYLWCLQSKMPWKWSKIPICINPSISQIVNVNNDNELIDDSWQEKLRNKSLATERNSERDWSVDLYLIWAQLRADSDQLQFKIQNLCRLFVNYSNWFYWPNKLDIPVQSLWLLKNVRSPFKFKCIKNKFHLLSPIGEKLTWKFVYNFGIAPFDLTIFFSLVFQGGM